MGHNNNMNVSEIIEFSQRTRSLMVRASALKILRFDGPVVELALDYLIYFLTTSWLMTMAEW